MLQHRLLLVGILTEPQIPRAAGGVSWQEWLLCPGGPPAGCPRSHGGVILAGFSQPFSPSRLRQESRPLTAVVVSQGAPDLQPAAQGVPPFFQLPQFACFSRQCVSACGEEMEEEGGLKCSWCWPWVLCAISCLPLLYVHVHTGMHTMPRTRRLASWLPPWPPVPRWAGAHLLVEPVPLSVCRGAAGGEHAGCGTQGPEKAQAVLPVLCARIDSSPHGFPAAGCSCLLLASPPTSDMGWPFPSSQGPHLTFQTEAGSSLDFSSGLKGNWETGNGCCPQDRGRSEGVQMDSWAFSVCFCGHPAGANCTACRVCHSGNASAWASVSCMYKATLFHLLFVETHVGVSRGGDHVFFKNPRSDEFEESIGACAAWVLFCWGQRRYPERSFSSFPPPGLRLGALSFSRQFSGRALGRGCNWMLGKGGEGSHPIGKGT